MFSVSACILPGVRVHDLQTSLSFAGLHHCHLRRSAFANRACKHPACGEWMLREAVQAGLNRVNCRLLGWSPRPLLDAVEPVMLRRHLISPAETVHTACPGGICVAEEEISVEST